MHFVASLLEILDALIGQDRQAERQSQNCQVAFLAFKICIFMDFELVTMSVRSTISRRQGH